MFWQKKQFHSRATSHPWVTALLALMVSAGAWHFGPGRLFDVDSGNTSAAVPVFGALWLLVFLLIHYAWGIRVWVRRQTVLTPRAEEDSVLSFRGLSRYSRGTLPARYITGLALYQFEGPWWRFWQGDSDLPDNAVVYRQPGYVGPGLLVSYRLPPHLVADTGERTWILPVPQARQLLRLLEDARPEQRISER